MGSNFSTGNTSVTGSVTSEAEEYTTVSASGTVTTGTTTLGTVPANKRWHIISASVGGVASANTPFYIQANGLSILCAQTGFGGSVLSSGNNSQTWKKGECPIIAATQTVTLVGGTGGTGCGTFTYIEESV